MRRAALTLAAWRRDGSGSTATEMALILPLFLLMLLGAIEAAQLGGAVSGLHFAVQEAARCFAVNKTTCGSGAAAVTYAETKYNGPAVSPVFQANNTGCGFTVKATGTFRMDLAVRVIDIPLNATSCYPGASSSTST